MMRLFNINVTLNSIKSKLASLKPKKRPLLPDDVHYSQCLENLDKVHGLKIKTNSDLYNFLKEKHARDYLQNPRLDASKYASQLKESLQESIKLTDNKVLETLFGCTSQEIDEIKAQAFQNSRKNQTISCGGCFSYNSHQTGQNDSNWKEYAKYGAGFFTANTSLYYLQNYFFLAKKKIIIYQTIAQIHQFLAENPDLDLELVSLIKTLLDKAQFVTKEITSLIHDFENKPGLARVGYFIKEVRINHELKFIERGLREYFNILKNDRPKAKEKAEIFKELLDLSFRKCRRIADLPLDSLQRPTSLVDHNIDVEGPSTSQAAILPIQAAKHSSDDSTTELLPVPGKKIIPTPTESFLIDKSLDFVFNLLSYVF